MINGQPLASPLLRHEIPNDSHAAFSSLLEIVLGPQKTLIQSLFYIQ